MKSINNFKKINLLKIICLYCIFMNYFVIESLNKCLKYLQIETKYSLNKSTYIIFTIFIVLCILSFRDSIDKIKKYKMEILILILILILVFISHSYIIHYNDVRVIIDYKIEYVSPIIYFYSILKNNIFYYVIFSFVGMNLNDIYKLIQYRFIKYINLIIYLIFIILLIYMNVENNISVFNTIFKQDIDNSYYLSIGDGFALFSIMIFCNSRKLLFWYIICIFTLFKIGSRTSLICTLIMLPLIIYYSIGKIDKIKKAIYFLFTTIVISFLIIYISFVQNGMFENNRMLRIFFQFSQDSSINSRSMMQSINLQYLFKNNFFTGQFLSEIKIFGIHGYYIHNILSYWAEFGVVVFISLVYIIIRNIIAIINLFVNKKLLNILFIFCFIIYIYISCVFSRSYQYSYLWIAIFAVKSIFNNNYYSKTKKGYLNLNEH